MSAAEALQEAQAAGVHVATDGHDLLLNAQEPPPPAVLSALARHKSEVVDLLVRRTDGWPAEDWQAFFDERAGIAEYDHGLSRNEAEARAYACCIAEWLIQRPVASQPSRCLCCDHGDQDHSRVLPFGMEPVGHAWLHAGCWPVWYEGRKAEAVAALAAMGIAAPANFPDDFGNMGEA